MSDHQVPDMETSSMSMSLPIERYLLLIWNRYLSSFGSASQPSILRQVIPQMPSTSLLDKRSLPPIASHHSISFDQETAKFKSIPQHIVPHVQMKSKVECTLIYCHKSFNICLSSSLFHTFFFSDFHYGSGRVLKRPDLLPMGNFFWKNRTGFQFIAILWSVTSLQRHQRCLMI